MIEAPVFVVDDDRAVLDSVVQLLRQAGFRTRGFTSGADFLTAAAEHACGCLVTDMRMPELDGAGLVRRLSAFDRKAWPVVILTGHADVPLAVQMMKSGVVDFIEKPFDPNRLIESVRGCLAALEGVQEDKAAGEAVRRRYEALTPREREVFFELVAGRTNKEIAGRLGVSPRTVEVFRASVMKKMNAESLAVLVRMGLNFVPPAAGSGETPAPGRSVG